MVEFSSFGVFPRLLSFAVDYAFEETEGRRGGGRGTVVVVFREFQRVVRGGGAVRDETKRREASFRGMF